MLRVLVFLFLSALAATNVHGFTVVPTALKVPTGIAGTSTGALTSAAPSFAAATALNMVKIKVDPNAKEERVNPAVFKNAIYLGSIAFAVLLPIFFLVAASK